MALHPVRSSRGRRLALLAPLFVLALLVQGCAPGGGGGGDPWGALWGGDGGSGQAQPPGVSLGEEDDDDTETPGRGQPAPAPGSSGGKACLTGTWKLDNSSFEAMLQQILASAPDVPAEFQGRIGIRVVGGSYAQFDGGTGFTAWQEGFGMVFDGGAMTITHAQDSRDTGNYGADDAHVWLQNVTTVSMKATMQIGDFGQVELDSASPGMATVDVFGQRGQVPGAQLDGPVDGFAQYQCDGSTLTLSVAGSGSARYARIG